MEACRLKNPLFDRQEQSSRACTSIEPADACHSGLQASDGPTEKRRLLQTGFSNGTPVKG